MKEHYQVLGVPRNATPGQIKKAYRELVKKYHPDLNHTAEAAILTSELNEAYDVLSDVRARAIYDVHLKVEASTRTQATDALPRSSETDFHFKSDTTICCERCGKADASLRISAIWVIFSFIAYSRKISAVKILCARCRVLETLTASAWTLVAGWWSPWGFFWTMEALVANACGGDQPEENNAALLKALSKQLYLSGKVQDAYKALRRGMELRWEVELEPTLEFLRKESINFPEELLWWRLITLKFHPFVYHTLFAVIGIIILICAVS